jgi:hypothetical protein
VAAERDRSNAGDGDEQLPRKFVKVVDFGIAKASTQLAQTRAGVLKGKHAYMVFRKNPLTKENKCEA